MKGSTFKRCACTELVVDEHGRPVLDAKGKPKRRQLGAAYPRLRRLDGSWNPKHGTWYFVLDVPPQGGRKRQQIKRGGYDAKDDAQDALDAVRRLLSIADDAEDDGATLAQIVELVQTSTKRREPLPNYDEVRRAAARPASRSPNA